MVESMTIDEIKIKYPEYKNDKIKYKDKTKEKYGKLTPLYRTENLNNHVRWVCKCDCGNYTIIYGSSLCETGTKSCGCSVHQLSANKKYNKYDLSREYGIGYFYNSNNVFLFDKEDYEKIKDYCWYENDKGYATSFYKTHESPILLHRLVMNISKDEIIDHKNRNRTDNRKNNLRIVTQHQNSFNKNKCSSNKTGITGVWWDKTKQRWVACIKYLGKNIRKYFQNYDDAVRARLKAEIKYFGKEFAPQRHLFKQYGLTEDYYE